MDQLRLVQALAHRDDFSLSEISLLEVVDMDDDSWLLAGSSASGALNRIDIAEGHTLDIEQTVWQSNAYRAVPLADGIVVRQNAQTCLLSLDGMSGGAILQDIADDGSVRNPTALRINGGGALTAGKLETVSTGAVTWIAAAEADGSGIGLYRLNADWSLTLSDTIADTLKSSARDISDLRSVSVGNQTYLVASSDSENGLTSYRVTANGQMQQVDNIGARDGLWAAGLAAVEEVEVNGQVFLIGAGTQSGTLSVVRLNEAGVFFPTDVEFDDRTTRFAGASVMESFEVADRAFIVVGGTDGGVSMFEILPGGDLYHHQDAVQTNDWDLGNVTGLAVHRSGDQVSVFVTGSNDGGLAHLTMDISSIGVHLSGSPQDNAITGSARDDVILGGAGNDTLHGGSGDDIIFAGTGENRLRGGEGEDVFVLSANSVGTRIEDFEPGVDRINLDGWGMLYDIDALDIASRNRGGSINWNGNEVNITTMTRTSIAVEDWDAEDFVF